MRLAGRKQFTMFEWVSIFVFAALAIVCARFLHLEGKWSDAFVYTVVLFGVVFLALRPAWGRKAFWKSIFPVLGLHILAIVVAMLLLPPSLVRLPWLVLTGIGMLEGLLIGGILWKRAAK